MGPYLDPSPTCTLRATTCPKVLSVQIGQAKGGRRNGGAVGHDDAPEMSSSQVAGGVKTQIS